MGRRWPRDGRATGAPRSNWAASAWTWCCRPPACTATTSPTSCSNWPGPRSWPPRRRARPTTPWPATPSAWPAKLVAQGAAPEVAAQAGATRIFASASGNYGTGLDNAMLATDTWKGKKEGDRKLAQLYLSRMQYAYGPDETTWGSLPGAAQEGKSGIGGRRQGPQPVRRAPERHPGRGAVAQLQPVRNADHRRPVPVPGRHCAGRAPPGRQGAGAVHQQPAREQRRARWKARRSSWPRSWPRASSTPATSRL